MGRGWLLSDASRSELLRCRELRRALRRRQFGGVGLERIEEKREEVIITRSCHLPYSFDSTERHEEEEFDDKARWRYVGRGGCGETSESQDRSKGERHGERQRDRPGVGSCRNF